MVGTKNRLMLLKFNGMADKLAEYPSTNIQFLIPFASGS